MYEVKNDNVVPFLLYAGPTSADLETLCRVSTKRRISVRIVSEGMPINTGLREGAAPHVISSGAACRYGDIGI